MTYSADIRQLALTIKLSTGSSIRNNVANKLQISPQTIPNWKKNIEPKAYKRKSSKIDDALLRKDVEMYPDAYQHERAKRFHVPTEPYQKL